jgi:hypothetical protein
MINIIKQINIDSKEPELDIIKSIATTENKDKLLTKNKSNKSLNENSIQTVTSFRAKPLPNYAVMEVKKSNSNLTVPKSPELMTKIRSKKKL